jgi:ATP-dependent DNA helicase RecQ
MFGFASLLPGQLETMACVLRGEDVLTILPTGGGKSLCYQLPALLDEDGTTLVISPLIALMKDQVDSLPAGLRGRATTINSSLDGDELRHRQEQVGYGAYRLVYAAPERLRQPPFLQALRGGDVRRMVIDEAHCVSVWGHDFRPDYLTVGEARQALGDPPLLAMTATAPLHVRRDIIDHLSSNESRKAQAHDLRIVASDVTRPNLQLEAFHAKDTHDKLQYLLAFCGSERGSGIVYADTRARCEELAALLNEYGIVAAHYHAGIEKRAEVQDDFMTGRTRVVVATVAFGLGIDKPDIRFIVHFRPPPSLEAYYQEAGRAGRDGEAARCLLMVSSGDRGTLTRRIHRDALTLDDLREVYGAVQRHLAPERVGRVATADLQRDLRCDNTRLRVALGFLGQAGLLKRGPDVPRAASVRLTAPLDAARRSGQSGSNDTLPPDLAAFCHAARLRPQQWLTIDLLRVAAEAGLPLADAERHLLTWAEQGWLSYSPAGRDLLLELPPAPDDAREHLASLLDRFAAIQEQRCDEIMAYAQTKACRHGHLNAYLGGRTITDCSSCDNCIPIAPPTAPNLPDEKEQIALVLSCLAANAWGWGRITLLRILRGDARARQSRNRRPLSARAQNDPTFGKLRFCSATHVRALIEVLEQEGFLHPRRLDHGGETLELTAKGQRALQDKDLLDPLISSPASPAGRERGENGGDVDENVLEALKAWRSEQAKTEGVPAYVIFHNSHLRAIAASMPRTTSDLSQVKGIGPKRLEAYGESLLELLADHQEDSPGEESSPPSVDAHAPKESAAPGEH